MTKEYMLERLKERSTWLGIVAFLTACGIPIAPLTAEQVVSIGLAISGLVGIFTADHQK